MTALSLIPNAEVVERWPDFRPFLAGMCERSNHRYEPADLLRLLLADQYQLWSAAEGQAIDAMMLTRVVEFPGAKACEMAAAFGENSKEWVGFIGEVEDWARGQGCGLMQPIGRPGWERVLKPFGYEKTHVLLEKKL